MGGGYCTGEEREKDKGGGEGRMGGKDEEKRGEEEKEGPWRDDVMRRPEKRERR